VEHLVIPAASVRLNPSHDSDWAKALFEFVAQATGKGKTVVVAADEMLLSPAQAAETAHVSRMTIQRRIADGTIPAVKRGSRWRIAESDLDRYRQRLWQDTVAALADDF
jgi:excisionase family DNA binding protein